jgi:CRISPR-associated endonuclease/helicase Cas3
VTRLALADFDRFVREAHDHTPFPWQAELVNRVVTDGRWPEVLDVPTGLGKTSVIDVVTFVNAIRPELGRRRVFFVVDRRLVVDEAHEHATRLAAALSRPAGKACAAVAAALRQPGDQDGPPLEVARMRGGLTWSWRWVERPDRYAVVVGTVDQVGSRLLFRGYGVGEQLRPVDAALVGTDSLIVVDEAHLAGAFLGTLRTAWAADQPRHAAGRPPLLLTMSATPGLHQSAATHGITQADRADLRAAGRLHAGKRLHLVEAPPGGDRATTMAGLLASWARELGDGDAGRVVGVVANTVATARAAHERLAATSTDCVLLTGRSRPVDREYLLARWYPRCKAGRVRQPGPPVFVVATQTVEVGANLDFDALVTESAPLAALVQRLGRLNRLGELDRAHAIVVHDPSTGTDDPVYGAARAATWSWLATRQHPIQGHPGHRSSPLGAGLDASPAALRAMIERLELDERARMREPQPYVPVLAPATLDAWTRTAPTPYPDPPVAPFLHGIDRGLPDVAVVWRSGLPRQRPDQWGGLVDLVPPAAEEQLEVPLGAVRRWLAHAGDPGWSPQADAALQVTDLGSEPPGTDAGNGRAGRPALRYRKVGDHELVTPVQLRPGDLLVVPAEYGGHDEFGWNPTSTEPVVDVADLADRRGRPLLRVGRALVEAVASRWHPELRPGLERLLALAQQDAADEDARPQHSAYRQLLRQTLGTGQASDPGQALPLVRVLARLAGAGRATVTSGGGPPEPAYPVLLATGIGGLADDATGFGSALTASRTPTPLAAHQAAVRARAEQFARNLNLDERLVRSVALAGELHDEGKRDPRFQAMLLGGDRLRTQAATQPLAKSGMDPADRRAFRLAQQRSGYPSGMRHEALSARIAQLHLPHAVNGFDRNLVVHLVAAHHGHSRPLLPPVADPDPVVTAISVDGRSERLRSDATVDWDAPRRFADLNQRYGRWGLALLEAVVRLADIWCSEREEQP